MSILEKWRILDRKHGECEPGYGKHILQEAKKELLENLVGAVILHRGGPAGSQVKGVRDDVWLSRVTSGGFGEMVYVKSGDKLHWPVLATEIVEVCHPRIEAGNKSGN